MEIRVRPKATISVKRSGDSRRKKNTVERGYFSKKLDSTKWRVGEWSKMHGRHVPYQLDFILQ